MQRETRITSAREMSPRIHRDRSDGADSAWRSRAWSPPGVANIRGNMEVEWMVKVKPMDARVDRAPIRTSVRFERRTGTEQTSSSFYFRDPVAFLRTALSTFFLVPSRTKGDEAQLLSNCRSRVKPPPHDLSSITFLHVIRSELYRNNYSLSRSSFHASIYFARHCSITAHLHLGDQSRYLLPKERCFSGGQVSLNRACTRHGCISTYKNERNVKLVLGIFQPAEYKGEIQCRPMHH